MKKVLALCLFFLFFLFPIFSIDFPAKLSDGAKISIFSVNYSDTSHSLFSKSCLRIYDKKNDFDVLVDFAHFDNFDDEFFGLKFFFKNKKAKIKIEPFFEYFMENSKRNNVSLTESVLQLNPQKVNYIYSFILNFYKALPDYEYDFDIQTNNSETHISRILHDADRMKSDKTIVSYSFSEISRHKLNYKKLGDCFALLSDKEVLDFGEQDFTEIFHDEKLSLVIFLSIVTGLLLFLTVYQVLTYFYPKMYIISIFASAEFFDFLILFFSGLAGFLILYQDLFSAQTLFRNNFQFLFLSPLHCVIAFSVFRPIKSQKFNFYYWSLTSFLSIVYLIGVLIAYHKIPLVNLFFVLPILIRTSYFTFLSLDIKKERTFKPYAPLVKFLDLISS
ncbi:MAG: DUF4105 domain-containing protein [Treponema sp.]|nr:DUF4105 domain-containing protein [Treponema sp.]